MKNKEIIVNINVNTKKEGWEKDIIQEITLVTRITCLPFAKSIGWRVPAANVAEPFPIFSANIFLGTFLYGLSRNNL